MLRKMSVIAVLFAASILLVLAVAASAAGHALEDPIPQPIGEGNFTISLETVASGFTSPNWGTSAPQACQRGKDRMYVVDQNGILWNVDLRSGGKSVYLDVSNRLVPLGAFGPGSFDERGFLGLAFHPDFHRNGLLYTYTSQPVGGDADFSTMPAGVAPNHQAVITEWHAPNPCKADSVVDPSSAREIMRVDEPQFNHNGGALEFGTDGMLFIALGDGGSRDDEGVGHGANGNGQDPSNVLGAILRIDPLGDNAANGQYGIPDDNPFVGQAGYADEIYAYGFRNPFRISVDPRSGDLYIAEVGQGDIEEIDVGEAGANYGWNLKEGSFCFEPNGPAPGFVFDCDLDGDLTDPIAEYDHDEGLSIIGGFVYRGSEMPALRGHYIFGDWNQNFFANNGRLFYLDEHHEIKEFNILGQEDLGLSLHGFGRDGHGEVYALANATGTPFGNTGVILRMVPVPLKKHYDATLTTGAQLHDVVGSEATGRANFQLRDDGEQMEFSLHARGLSGPPWGAHIHGPATADQNAGILVPLCGRPAPTIVTTCHFEDGTLAVNGSITSNFLAQRGLSMQDLLVLMTDGLTYVNVHTDLNAPGEVRGQIN